MYSEIVKNKRKTVILIAGFLVLIATLSYFAGVYFKDYTITIGALIGSFFYVLFSYFGSASAALAFNGAKSISKKDDPRLWRTVENLAITEGLPMPKVYIMQDPGLNAFATGRDPKHASVAVTSGLLEALDNNELQGVMAHELAHVKNYDIRVSIVVFGLVSIVSIFADIFLRISLFGRNSDDESDNTMLIFLGIVAIILAPIIAALIQSAISRKREYLADASSALATRYPEGLASALEKIKAGGSVTKRQNTSTAHLFIANPLKGKSFAGLFSTHPDINDRIKVLRSIGNKL